jgi:hypothetical protein
MKHSAVRLLVFVLCIAPLARAEDGLTGRSELQADAGPADAHQDQTASIDPSALDAPPETGQAPYEPWTGSAAFPAPRPLTRRSTQGPLTPGLELARSPVELVAGAGPVFGWCFGGTATSFPCRALEPGLGASLSGLWRVTPFFAWGARLTTNFFAYEPPEKLDAERSRALLGALEIVARVYPSDEGVLDPYAELGLGGALLRAAFSGGPAADFVDSAYAPSAHVGGGLDFILGRRAKVGFAVSLNQLFVPGLRRCPARGDGACTKVEGSDRGYVSSTLELGGRFTLMLGNEL